MNTMQMPSGASQNMNSASMANVPSMALVSDDQVTHRAVNSGDWSNISTGEGGQVPPEGARVLISRGVTVKVGVQMSEAKKAVRIDGTLEFASDTNLSRKSMLLSLRKAGRRSWGPRPIRSLSMSPPRSL